MGCAHRGADWDVYRGPTVRTVLVEILRKVQQDFSTRNSPFLTGRGEKSEKDFGKIKIRYPLSTT